MAEEGFDTIHFATPDDDSQRLALLEKAVSGITRHKQMILQMRYTEGMTARQIAEQLGISTRTVENTIFRCINDLRNEMNNNTTDSKPTL